MTSMLAIFLFGSAASLLIWMLVQARHGKHDLMCLRNLFLLGLIVFQFVSGGLSLWTLNFVDFFVFEPLVTGAKFTALLMIFLALFLWSYQSGWFVRARAWRSAFPFPDQKPTTILLLAALFLGIGFVFRVVIGRNVPVLGVLTDIMAIGILAGAAGLAAWAWVPRLWNPAVAFPAMFIILGAIGSTVFLTFGRRDVLSVLLTVLFAAYHSSWKYQGWLRLSGKLGLIVGVGLLFLAAFTTVRFASYKSFDLGDFVKSMTEADVSGGIEALASGQLAAQNSMWVIENRPPFDPLHSVIYTITQPIPRIVWPDKPVALGYSMVREASIYRGDPNFTVGPGLVGHIWNDNPFLSLVPYAIFFGLLWRFCDERVTAHPANPFVILPVVVGAGDLIGIPRGEVGLFLFRCLTAMFTAWVAMRFCTIVLRTFGGIPKVSAEPQGDPLDPELAWDGADPSYVPSEDEQTQDSHV